MSKDEFTKLFKYMQAEFKKIHDQLEQTATKEELDRLTGAVDAYAKQSETYMQEMLAKVYKSYGLLSFGAEGNNMLVRY
jgi:hypothetical protein